jgi:hypothetical protein
MTRYCVEVEETRRGFVIIEGVPGETRSHVRDRAREAVEDLLLLPIWEEDEIEVSTDNADGLRCYDADEECRQKVGCVTAFCDVHWEPMLKGLDYCERRADDLTQQAVDQERLW